MQSELEKIGAKNLKSLALRVERGVRMKQARKQAMLPIKTISYEIGMSIATYRKMENGAISPRLDNLELFAVHTKTDLSWLLYGVLENGSEGR